MLWLVLGESEHFGEDGVVDDVVIEPAGEEGLEDESEPSGNLLVVLQGELARLLLLEFRKALWRVLVAQLQLKVAELEDHLLE